MGEKDITEKILEDHNDVFADIINGLIFAGEQRILPESLENTAVHSQYKADDEKVHELERDVANFFVQKRKNKDYIPDDPTEIKHIDEVLKLLQVMTGDEHYKEVIRKKKGVRSMCDVAERLEKMGIAKGIEIGKSEGIIEGKMQVYKSEQDVGDLHIYPTDYFAAKDYDTGKVHKTMNTISIHQYNASWKTPKQKLVYKIKMVIGEKNFEKLLEVKKRIK